MKYDYIEVASEIRTNKEAIKQYEEQGWEFVSHSYYNHAIVGGLWCSLIFRKPKTEENQTNYETNT